MVIEEYLKIRGKYMSAKAIQSAFCHCSIWPFNPQIFTAADFAPSKMTSTCSTVTTVAALPLNRELGSGRVGSILDVGFSLCTAPTFYRCPGISHISRVLGSSETRNPGARISGRIVQG